MRGLLFSEEKQGRRRWGREKNVRDWKGKTRGNCSLNGQREEERGRWTGREVEEERENINVSVYVYKNLP